MTVVTVTEAAKWIAGVYSNSFLVRNCGESTVYLGQDSSLTVGTRAITLGPGSSLNWQGKTELWAVTDAGLTGELEWLYDADTTFTPGPTSVNAHNKWRLLSDPDLPAQTLAPLQSHYYPSLMETYDVSDYTTVAISIFRSTPLVSITPVYVTIRWPGSGVQDTYRMSVNGRVRIRTSVKSAEMQIEIQNGTSNPPTTNDFVYESPTVWASATPAKDYYRHGYFFSFGNITERAVDVTGASSNVENWESGFTQINFTGIASTPGYYYYDSLAGETEISVLQATARQLRMQVIPVTETVMDTNPGAPAGTLCSIDAPASVVQIQRFITPPAPMRIFVRSEVPAPAFQVVLSTLNT